MGRPAVIEFSRGRVIPPVLSGSLEAANRAAAFVDKILNGAERADLPAEQPTGFDFVINLKAARAMGLTIPQSVPAQATEVIE